MNICAFKCTWMESHAQTFCPHNDPKGAPSAAPAAGGCMDALPAGFVSFHILAERVNATEALMMLAHMLIIKTSNATSKN